MTTQAIKTALDPRSLRNLYFLRTAVQLIWAVAVIGAAANPNLAATLLILYPLWDVACTLYELRTSRGSASVKTLSINAFAGLVTALGFGLTAYSQPQIAVAIFGGWALTAGLLQLVMGILRRQRLGGQWAMILSGVQSAIAGVIFVLGGLAGKMHIKDLGGYAIFGAIYFLIGGILLSRKLPALEGARQE